MRHRDRGIPVAHRGGPGELTDGFWLVLQCAQGGCDVDVSGRSEDVDGQVSQAVHHVGGVAGTDLRSIFAVRCVPDLAQAVLNAPMTADQLRQLPGTCQMWWQRNDHIDLLSGLSLIHRPALRAWIAA